MAWTEEQNEAIKKEGTNIIVSAGAGSGKTAVLTERVKRKLKSGVHINELLVLTFTNAAAAEMKDRIRDAINTEEGLEEEANLIEGAYITTFDSFSLSMVKKYHTILNITNNIKISDDVIIDMKKHELLDSIFDRYYDNNNSKFINLISDFCLKDDKDLKNNILNVYKKIELKYDKDDYLNNYFDIEFTEDRINKHIDEYINIIKRKQDSIKNLLIDLNEYFDGEFIVKVEDNLSKLINAKTYDEFLNGLELDTIKVPKGSSETGKKIKNQIFDIAKEIKELCIYNSIDEMKEELLSTKSNIEIIIDIIKELNNELKAWKIDNEIFNFNDIAHMAIKIVKENDNVRNELKNRFNEILVDEYQDTSDTQELFINLISNNNVYMVGDIKQSIYRFRNANPYIFKNKYDLYSNRENGIKIDLLKNFRSREEVLITYNDTGKVTKDEEEAFIIGNDIKNKINNKFQVFDKEKKVLRDITYSDFVILLDKSKNFDLYKKIFEYLQIPLSILKDESLKKDDDLLVIRNILRLIICIKENRLDTEFKYVYTSISRSYLYKITDEELYNIINNNSYSETNLYKICNELSMKLDYTSPSEFYRLLLNTFEYDKKLITRGNIKSFIVRSEYIYNLIKEFESTGKTIYEFVDYLNEIVEGDYDLSFNINSSSTNTCKIMTIHKSKGLEFPICYFAGFKSLFNMSELKEKIIYDNNLGIVLPKVDEYYKDTILKTILKANTKYEEISEKIRLLYVAVTRAKEKIIIVIPELEEQEEINNIVPLFEREKYNSFLSIIKSIYSNLNNYISKTDIIGTKDYQLQNNNRNNDLKLDKDNIIVKEIHIDNNVIEESHYSKSSIHIITKEEKDLLEFGTKVHETLELIDFNNIDNYEIEDKYIKNKILSFINSDLMKDKLNYNMYKEYEFIYEENNTISHGIIDLLIDCLNYYVIIDYKLKNIDDSLYDKQLNGYRNYIKNKTGKEVKCYLYSIIDENVREVI